MENEVSARKTHLGIRINKETLKELQRIAKKQDRSVSYLVHHLIVAFLAQQESH